MSDNVLETVRATVQDLIAPELKTHGVRLENLDKRIDEVNKNLEHRIEDSKETLRAEMKTLEAKMGTFEARMDARLDAIETLIRNLIQQNTIESSLRERVASLEARMPKQ